MRPGIVYTLLDDDWHVALGHIVNERRDWRDKRVADLLVYWRGSLRFVSAIEHYEDLTSAHYFVAWKEIPLMERELEQGRDEFGKQDRLEELRTILHAFSIQ